MSMRSPLLDAAPPSAGLVSLGVDWITGTSKAGYSGDSWDALCGELLLGDTQDGNICRPWSMLGYEGLKSGQVFCGERHDGALVQVTGGSAARLWPRVASFCESISRVDLQATICLESDPYKYVRRVDQRLRSAKKRRGRGPKIAFQRSENGGATAYVGRKSSKRYGRCYNKHAESGLEIFRGCVRWEAVFREELGSRVVRYLYRAPVRELAIGATLFQYFEEVGGGPPRFARDTLIYEPAGFLRPDPSSTDSNRQLKWLATQVRPTFQRLIDLGYGRAALSALGLRGVVQHTEREQ